VNCNEARRYISPYLDSELDATTIYEISRHLEACPDCARLFAAEEALERAMTGRMRRPDGDEDRVFRRVLEQVLAPPRRRRRMPAWSLLPALAAASALVALSLYLRPRPPELLVMASKDHAQYLRGELRFEVTGGGLGPVRGFLRDQAIAEGDALAVPPEWRVTGARLCRFRGLRLGYVMLERGSTAVSLILVGAEEARALPDALGAAAERRCFELPGGRGLVRRSAGGLRAAFGDVDSGFLEELAGGGR